MVTEGWVIIIINIKSSQQMLYFQKYFITSLIFNKYPITFWLFPGKHEYFTRKHSGHYLLLWDCLLQLVIYDQFRIHNPFHILCSAYFSQTNLTHSLGHSLTYPLTHSLAHSLAHSAVFHLSLSLYIRSLFVPF